MQQIMKLFKMQKFNTLKRKANNLEKKIPDATAVTQINQYNTNKQDLEKNVEMFIKNTRYKQFKD